MTIVPGTPPPTPADPSVPVWEQYYDGNGTSRVEQRAEVDPLLPPAVAFIDPTTITPEQIGQILITLGFMEPS